MDHYTGRVRPATAAARPSARQDTAETAASPCPPRPFPRSPQACRLLQVVAARGCAGRRAGVQASRSSRRGLAAISFTNAGQKSCLLFRNIRFAQTARCAPGVAGWSLAGSSTTRSSASRPTCSRSSSGPATPSPSSARARGEPSELRCRSWPGSALVLSLFPRQPECATAQGGIAPAPGAAGSSR